MISAAGLRGLAEMFFAGALFSVALGGPIVLLAWSLVRLGGRQSSRARFGVWYAALVGILLAGFVGRGAGSVGGASSQALIRVSDSWAIVSLSAWALFATCAFLRLGLGLVRVRNLRRGGRGIELAGLDPLLREALEEVSCGRKVEVRVAEDLKVPAAVGFFRPVVILPGWALRELSAAEMRPILLHELAHVKRWDDWTNLLQKAIQAALFFHPAVWFIERRISLEREMACDDVVLAHTANPRAYAESLLSVAEKSFGRRGLALAQAAVDRMRQTSARIAQILDTNRKRSGSIWTPATLALAAAFGLGFVVLAKVPELISFSSPANLAAVNVAGENAAMRRARFVPVAKTFARGPRRIRAAAFKIAAKRAPRSWSSAPRSLPVQNVLQAGFNAEGTRPGGDQDGGELRFTQATFVVMRPGVVADSPEFVTVRVWEWTVFRCNHPVETAFPAKKI